MDEAYFVLLENQYRDKEKLYICHVEAIGEDIPSPTAIIDEKEYVVLGICGELDSANAIKTKEINAIVMCINGLVPTGFDLGGLSNPLDPVDVNITYTENKES